MNTHAAIEKFNVSSTFYASKSCKHNKVLNLVFTLSFALMAFIGYMVFEVSGFWTHVGFVIAAVLGLAIYGFIYKFLVLFLTDKLNIEPLNDPLYLEVEPKVTKEDEKQLLQQLSSMQLKDVFYGFKSFKLKSKLCSCGLFSYSTDEIMNNANEQKYKESIQKDEQFKNFYYINKAGIELLEAAAKEVVEPKVQELQKLLASDTKDIAAVLEYYKNYTSLSSTIKSHLCVDVEKQNNILPKKDELLAYFMKFNLTQKDFDTIKEFILYEAYEFFGYEFIHQIHSKLFTQKQNEQIKQLTQQNLSDYFNLYINYDIELITLNEQIMEERTTVTIDETDYTTLRKTILQSLEKADLVTVENIDTIYNIVNEKRANHMFNSIFFTDLIESFVYNKLQNEEQVIQMREVMIKWRENHSQGNENSLSGEDGYYFNWFHALYLILKENKVHVCAKNIDIWTNCAMTKKLFYLLFSQERFDNIDRINILNWLSDVDAVDNHNDVYVNGDATAVALYQYMKSEAGTIASVVTIDYVLNSELINQFDIKDELNYLVNEYWNNLFILEELTINNNNIKHLVAKQLGDDVVRNIKTQISNLQTQEFVKQKADEQAQAARAQAQAAQEQAQYQRIQAQNAQASSRASQQAARDASKARSEIEWQNRRLRGW